MQPLHIAVTYHLPEGRFFDAPVKVKKKRRGHYWSALVLAITLSAAPLPASYDEQETTNLAANSTIFDRALSLSAQRRDDNLDYTTTSSVTLAKNYQAVPMSAENIANKLGVKDPNPDEARINRREKTENFKVVKTRINLDKPRVSRIPVSVPKTINSAKTSSEKVSFLQSSEQARRYAALAVSIIPAQKPERLPVPEILTALVTNHTPDTLALAYANNEVARQRGQAPFDAILKKPASVNSDASEGAYGRFIPPIGPDDHAWAATPLPPSSFTPIQQKCLAEAIYFEARGETLKGQVAVAQVVLNRVRNPEYPKTICAVVYQNNDLFNHCQFSFACDGQQHRVTELKAWLIARQIALAATAGQIWLADVGSATHYHANDVHPMWASAMVKLEQIGAHIFYRTRNGGWS